MQNAEGVTSIKNGGALAISISNQIVVKKEHDRVSFQILYPKIQSINRLSH